MDIDSIWLWHKLLAWNIQLYIVVTQVALVLILIVSHVLVGIESIDGYWLICKDVEDINWSYLTWNPWYINNKLSSGFIAHYLDLLVMPFSLKFPAVCIHSLGIGRKWKAAEGIGNGIRYLFQDKSVCRYRGIGTDAALCTFITYIDLQNDSPPIRNSSQISTHSRGSIPVCISISSHHR